MISVWLSLQVKCGDFSWTSSIAAITSLPRALLKSIFWIVSIGPGETISVGRFWATRDGALMRCQAQSGTEVLLVPLRLLQNQSPPIEWLVGLIRNSLTALSSANAPFSLTQPSDVYQLDSTNRWSSWCTTQFGSSTCPFDIHWHQERHLKYTNCCCTTSSSLLKRS